MIARTDITGVVLAGGLGRRMSADGQGTDKGLQPFRGQPLVAQALAWPGKLSTTVGSVATGIVSGVLMWQGTTVTRDDAARSGQTDGGGLYQLEQRFTGVVLTAADIV